MLQLNTGYFSNFIVGLIILTFLIIARADASRLTMKFHWTILEPSTGSAPPCGRERPVKSKKKLMNIERPTSNVEWEKNQL